MTRPNVHILTDALPIVQAERPRRNIRLLDSVAEQKNQEQADRELLAMLLLFGSILAGCA